LDAGISTRRGIMNSHREKAYDQVAWRCAHKNSCACAIHTCQALSHSELAQEQSIAIPLYAQMTTEEQDRVVDALRHALTT
jgi:perosamine synthetase